MKENEISVTALLQKVAQMEADIKTTVSVLADLLRSFGIDPAMFKDGAADLQSQIPMLVGKLARDLMIPGNFNTQSIANVKAIAPIIERYKYLVESENESNGKVG